MESEPLPTDPKGAAHQKLPPVAQPTIRPDKRQATLGPHHPTGADGGPTLDESRLATARSHAIDALSVHVGEGRLTMSEFENRCAQALQAATDLQIDALFTDLPSPHPAHMPTFNTQTQPPVRQRYINILDQRIGNTPLTHRKFRIIGWILAVLWIPLCGEIIEWLLPEALEIGVMMTPIVLMIIYTIAVKPTKPKYRYITPPQPKSPYPY